MYLKVRNNLNYYNEIHSFQCRVIIRFNSIVRIDYKYKITFLKRNNVAFILKELIFIIIIFCSKDKSSGVIQNLKLFYVGSLSPVVIFSKYFIIF